MAYIKVKLKKADPLEFTICKGKIKLGKLFFLKSSTTKKFDKGVYYTYDGMDLEEFRNWFRLEMVYVPISPIEAISIIEN